MTHLAEQALDQSPSEMTPGWSDVNDTAAMQEGWSIFSSKGSANGPWQVQAFDDASDVPGAPQLDTDEDAWKLVLQGKEAHHAAALAFIKAHNPIEYEAIMEFAEKEEIGCAMVPGFCRPCAG